jgi:ATP-dependent DNA ligase
VGRLKGKELIYAGKVDHGFDSASAKDLQARLKPLIRRSLTLKKSRTAAYGVEPSLMAEIEYRAKSAEGKVRHPFFKGLREDLSVRRAVFRAQPTCGIAASWQRGLRSGASFHRSDGASSRASARGPVRTQSA